MHWYTREINQKMKEQLKEVIYLKLITAVTLVTVMLLWEVTVATELMRRMETKPHPSPSHLINLHQGYNIWWDLLISSGVFITMDLCTIIGSPRGSFRAEYGHPLVSTTVFAFPCITFQLRKFA
jgi:hypothetical protein